MLWHSTILGPTFLERTSTFIVLSSIVKSPIKCLSFFPYRFISLRSSALGVGKRQRSAGRALCAGAARGCGHRSRPAPAALPGAACGARLREPCWALRRPPAGELRGPGAVSAPAERCGDRSVGNAGVRGGRARELFHCGARAAAGPLPACPARGRGGRGLGAVPGAVPDPGSTFVSSSRARSRGLQGKNTVPYRSEPGPATLRRGLSPMRTWAGDGAGSRARVSFLGLASTPARPPRQRPLRGSGDPERMGQAGRPRCRLGSQWVPLRLRPGPGLRLRGSSGDAVIASRAHGQLAAADRAARVAIWERG